jgi:hypothetical protein
MATFLFGSFVFQNAPGNTFAAQNTSFGANGGLYRNVGPIIAALAPPASLTALPQPAAFNTTSVNVIDPDLQFPQMHEWSLSFQREVGSNVVEVNYIGKHGVHLIG